MFIAASLYSCAPTIPLFFSLSKKLSIMTEMPIWLFLRVVFGPTISVGAGPIDRSISLPNNGSFWKRNLLIPNSLECCQIIMFSSERNQRVDMSEWLRRQTRNLLGFACAGSNPAVDVPLLVFLEFFSPCFWY